MKEFMHDIVIIYIPFHRVIIIIQVESSLLIT